MHHFLLAFIPLFAAIDAPGILPIYVAMTHDIEPAKRRSVLNRACLTAFAVAAGFMLGGKLIFSLLSITPDDFRIAGGLLLLTFATADILFPSRPRRQVPPEEVGAVPLGTPLIVGPAALTTILMCLDTHGAPPTFAALVVNMVIVRLTFGKAERIVALVGTAASGACAKLASLLLAAIGVMMIRVGIQNLVR